MLSEKFKTPAEFALYAVFQHKGEPHVTRVAMTMDLREVPKLIEEDRKSMGETFGGLIAPTSTNGRSYRLFRASWIELDPATLEVKGGL